MKTAILIFFVSISLLANSQVPAKLNGYDGSFCKGIGDPDFLRLIDESFAFFNPNPTVPNLTMVYKPEWDTFHRRCRLGSMVDPEQLWIFICCHSFSAGTMVLHSAAILGSVLGKPG